MGVFDDAARLIGAAAQTPRPGVGDAIKQAADAAEQAAQFRDAAAGVSGATAGAPGFNPFQNAAAYNAAVRGSGVVKAIVDTGQRFAETPIYDITLEVTVDGTPPYEVVHRQMIAAAALGNWQPGKSTTLRVDPTDPTKVMLG
ncbi:hypothetical protein BH10ACT7_BH10ACT7_03950 [soil metagenome]